MSATPRIKKAVNVLIPTDLIEAARAQKINLSATLQSAIEQRLRLGRREKWLAENADSIESYNRDVEERGTFGERVRTF
jgi:antitoxin CcdA